MKLVAIYEMTSEYEIDFDLNEVDDLYVKWDTLYVRHKGGETFVSYEPTITTIDEPESVKNPDYYRLFDDYEQEVEVKKFRNASIDCSPFPG